MAFFRIFKNISRFQTLSTLSKFSRFSKFSRILGLSYESSAGPFSIVIMKVIENGPPELLYFQDNCEVFENLENIASLDIAQYERQPNESYTSYYIHIHV